MSNVRYGVIVIGGGPAGTRTALEAAAVGRQVLLVDTAARPGAVSGLSTIVTTSLLRSATRGPRPGAGELAPLVGKLRVALDEELAASERRLAVAGVQVLRGRAVLCPSNEVFVHGHGTVAASQVVLATGSRPRRPRCFSFDDRLICDEDSILSLANGLPHSLVIVGADVTGCEFACLFAALGANVTLVERRRRLLRCADPEILEVLHGEMQRLGVVVSLEEEICGVEVTYDRLEPHALVRLGSGRSEVCDRLLVLAGREGAVDAVACRALGIDLDEHGFVVVDESFRSTRPGVYAVGDVVGPPFRAGFAPYQARTAIFDAVGREPPKCEWPMTAHTLPELAVVGLIEDALKRLDVPYAVGRAHFSALQRADLDGGTRGLLKLACARDGRRLLGVQIIGPGAGELIHLGATMIHAGGTIDQLIDQVYSHPSLSEAYRDAALDAAADVERPHGRTAGNPPGPPPTHRKDRSGCSRQEPAPARPGATVVDHARQP
jgi:NAD(P) transhydrogenase